MPTVNPHDSHENTARDWPWPSHSADVPTNTGPSLLAQVCYITLHMDSLLRSRKLRQVESSCL